MSDDKVKISKKSGAKVYHKIDDDGETVCGKLNESTREKRSYDGHKSRHEYGGNTATVTVEEALKFGYTECHECFNDGYSKTVLGMKSEIEEMTGLELSDASTVIKDDVAKISEWIKQQSD